jgi:hypothetical protein
VVALVNSIPALAAGSSSSAVLELAGFRFWIFGAYDVDINFAISGFIGSPPAARAGERPAPFTGCKSHSDHLSFSFRAVIKRTVLGPSTSLLPGEREPWAIAMFP